MKTSSDDASKRVPALIAGLSMAGTYTSKLEKTSAYKTLTSLKSIPRVHLAQAKIDLKQKKNIIVALVALNVALVGLTAHRDQATRVQQVQAIESIATIKPESARTITVQPIKAPEGQVAVVEAEEVIPTPTPTPAPQVAGVSIARTYQGNAGALVRQAATARWGAEQAEYLMQLMGKESGLNPYAVNPYSGACGIPQAYPCSKLLAVIGSLDNVEGQVQWLINYVSNRYGTPGAALAHHRANNWY